MINQVNLSDAKDIWDATVTKNSLRVPFLTHVWHTNWKNILGGEFEPLYLVIDDEIVAPFVRDGAKVIFSGGAEVADYLDLIGPDGKKGAAWEQIFPFLKNIHCTSLDLRNVPENSPTLTYFKNQPSAEIHKEDTTPKLQLPASWELYTESLDRKYRHELERKIRKFEREHIDAQLIESTDPAADIDILLNLMDKDEEKSKFLTSDMKSFFRKTAETYTQTISLLIITMGDKKAAATLSFIDNGVSYLYNSGFDKNCCPNAGFYLKALALKDAIGKNVREYNFLQGDERYKYELGGKDFFVYTINAPLT